MRLQKKISPRSEEIICGSFGRNDFPRNEILEIRSEIHPFVSITRPGCQCLELHFMHYANISRVEYLRETKMQYENTVPIDCYSCYYPHPPSP